MYTFYIIVERERWISTSSNYKWHFSAQLLSDYFPQDKMTTRRASDLFHGNAWPQLLSQLLQTCKPAVSSRHRISRYSSIQSLLGWDSRRENGGRKDSKSRADHSLWLFGTFQIYNIIIGDIRDIQKIPKVRLRCRTRKQQRLVDIRIMTATNLR